MEYLVIALVASTIGAISGVGGGVMIKPLLDLFSQYSVETISLLSSFTVLAMAIAAVIKHIQYKTEFKKDVAILLASGAVAGGFIGDRILARLISLFKDASNIKIIQNILLLLLLIMVLIYINKFKKHIKFKVENKVIIVLIGIILGMISTFIGIGGGPINIVVLTLLFSMDTKDAAVNSLVLILFSQMAKITNVAFSQGLGSFDLSMLIYMIPAGILGGILGSKLNKTLKSKDIQRIFNCVLIFIIFINIFNIIK